MQQVARAESLTPSNFGITTRLFGQSWWEYTRFNYVNIDRSAIADNCNHINASFTNNSQVAVDLSVFIFYSDELKINCENDIVTKKINF